MILRPRIKICCISNVTEAQMAVDAGADALGLVSKMPSGPGVISEKLIAKIAASVPPPIATFLLTSKQDAKSIVSQQRQCGANTIQLCDCVPRDCYHQLRAQMPGVRIVQVIHVTGEESVTEALAASQHVDAILLDSGNQKLAVKELGGTGRTHNWRISRKIVGSVRVPVFLAGGLTPENVALAIEEVRPFGLDVCSGVRTEGRLSKKKLAHFFQSVEAVGK